MVYQEKGIQRIHRHWKILLWDLHTKQSSQVTIYCIIKQHLLSSVLSHSDFTKLHGVEASFASVVLSKQEKKIFLETLYLSNTFQPGAYESVLDGAVSYGPRWILEHFFPTQS